MNENTPYLSEERKNGYNVRQRELAYDFFLRINHSSKFSNKVASFTNTRNELLNCNILVILVEISIRFIAVDKFYKNL